MIRFIALMVAFTPGLVVAQDFQEQDRDPAALGSTPASLARRNYPGGADEEDLRVQTSLPEAAVHTDARSIQKEVYKSLYNQELKDESHAPPVEE